MPDEQQAIRRLDAATIEIVAAYSACGDLPEHAAYAEADREAGE